MDIFEHDRSAELGQDGERIGIPFNQDVARLYFLSFLYLEDSAVSHGVAFLLAAAFVGDNQRAVAVHHNQVSIPVCDVLNIQELDDSFVLRFFGGLLVRSACRATNMERSHGQLRAGLADGLGCDNAGSLAQVHQLAGRKVASVTFDANAAFRLAGQHGPDLDLLDTGRLNVGSQRLRNFLIHAENRFPGKRIFDVLEGHSSDDAVAERFDNLPAFNNGCHIDAVEGVAILGGYNHVLRHVNQPTGKVTGICRLQRRISQAFASAVSRDEVLQHSQSLAEIGRNRRLDDFA